MDNHRVYRTIRMAIKQLYPTEPKGNLALRLTTLAALVAGIVQARSCQLPAIARKTPDMAKATVGSNATVVGYRMNALIMKDINCHLWVSCWPIWQKSGNWCL